MRLRASVGRARGCSEALERRGRDAGCFWHLWFYLLRWVARRGDDIMKGYIRRLVTRERRYWMRVGADSTACFLVGKIQETKSVVL